MLSLSVMSTPDSDHTNNTINNLYDTEETHTNPNPNPNPNLTSTSPDTKECRVVMPKLNAQLDSHLSKKKTINLKWLKEIVAVNLARQNVANNQAQHRGDDVEVKNTPINPTDRKSAQDMTFTVQPFENSCNSGHAVANCRNVWDSVSNYRNGDNVVAMSTSVGRGKEGVFGVEKDGKVSNQSSDILSRVMNEVFFEWENSDDDENNNEKMYSSGDIHVNLSYQVEISEISCLLDDVVEKVVEDVDRVSEEVDRCDVESVVSDYMSLKLSSDSSDDEEVETLVDSRLNNLLEQNGSILDWLNTDKCPTHSPINDGDLPDDKSTDYELSDKTDKCSSKRKDDVENLGSSVPEKVDDVINNVVYAIVNTCDGKATDGEIPKLRLTKEIVNGGEEKVMQKVLPLRLSLKEIQEANDSKTLNRITKKFVRLSLDDDEDETTVVEMSDDKSSTKEKVVHNVFELKSSNNKQVDHQSLPLLIFAKVDENHVIEAVNCCGDVEQRRVVQNEEQDRNRETQTVEEHANCSDEETDDEKNCENISAHKFDVMADELSRDFHFDVEDAEAFKASARELLSQDQSLVLKKRKRRIQQGRKRKRRQQSQTTDTEIDEDVERIVKTICQQHDELSKQEKDNIQQPTDKVDTHESANIRDNADKKQLESQPNDTAISAEESHSHIVIEDEYHPSTNDESSDDDEEEDDDDEDDALWTRPNVATRSSTSVPDLEGMLTRMKSLRKRGGEDIEDLKFDDPIPLEYKRRRRRRQMRMEKRKQRASSKESRVSSVESVSTESTIEQLTKKDDDDKTEENVDTGNDEIETDAAEEEDRLVIVLPEDIDDNSKNKDDKPDAEKTPDETPLDLSNKKTPTPTPSEPENLQVHAETPVLDKSQDIADQITVEDGDNSLPKITNVVSLADNNNSDHPNNVHQNHNIEFKNYETLHPFVQMHLKKTQTVEKPKPNPANDASTESLYSAFNNEQFQNEYRKLRRELATLDMVALQKEKERNNILRLKKYKQSVMQQLQIKRGLVNGQTTVVQVPLPTLDGSSAINSMNSATVQPANNNMVLTATAKMSCATDVTQVYRPQNNPTVIRPIVTKAVRLAAPAPIRPIWPKDMKLTRPDVLTSLSSIDTIVAKANENFGLQTCYAATPVGAQYQQRMPMNASQVRPTIHVPITIDPELLQLPKELERNLKQFSLEDLIQVYKQMLQQQPPITITNNGNTTNTNNNNNSGHKIDQNGSAELIIQPQHLLLPQPIPIPIPIPIQSTAKSGGSTQQQQQQQQHQLTKVPVPARPMVQGNERLPDCYRNSALAHLLIRQNNTTANYKTTTQVSNTTNSVTINNANDKRRTISHVDRKLVGRRWPTCHSCHRQMARYICAGCNQQWYCSEACQVVDWKTHFKSCRQ